MSVPVTIVTLIVSLTIKYYPEIQAIYQFGSSGTEFEKPDSDTDIALLLPPNASKTIDWDRWILLQSELEKSLNKPVDLINLRGVSTVFQKEVIMADRRIYTRDWYAAEEFEMLTISLYLKLNEERAEIIKSGLKEGRFYNV